MRDYFMLTSRLGFGTWTPDDLPLAVGLWGDAEVTRLIGGPFSEDWVRDRLEREISLYCWRTYDWGSILS